MNDTNEDVNTSLNEAAEPLPSWLRAFWISVPILLLVLSLQRLFSFSSSDEGVVDIYLIVISGVVYIWSLIVSFLHIRYRSIANSEADVTIKWVIGLLLTLIGTLT